MVTEYDLSLNGEIVGKAMVSTQGLYYFFDCRCMLPKGKYYRITVTSGEIVTDLGTCVSQGLEFGIRTKISTKKVGPEPLIFHVCTKMRECDEMQIPISETKPFDYLYNIATGYFIRENGKNYIKFAK